MKTQILASADPLIDEIMGYRKAKVLMVAAYLDCFTHLEVSRSAGALAACRMLFVTGDILNAKVLEFLSKTKSEYLVKPFDIQELRQTARRLLRQPPR